MDAHPLDRPLTIPRPEGCGKIALVLQGGGALGSYQAGVYQALHQAGLEPEWIDGISIGGINAAIIAGNPPELRLPRLTEFWESITSMPANAPKPEGDWASAIYSTWSSLLTMAFGQPGFFYPRMPSPLFRPRGADGATSFYDTTPLYATLERLVDFDRINRREIRFAVGATNIETGNLFYFDNENTVIGPEHILASAALPPGLPMVQVGSDWFWDGGVVSNTPLQHLLSNAGRDSMLVFQVDLFNARGNVPRDMLDVINRHKEIQYSSRTRLTTDHYATLQTQKRHLRCLLQKIPENQLTTEEKLLKEKLDVLPSFTVLHLIRREAPFQWQIRDFEFSASSMREHWEAGYRDTRATIMHKEWMRVPLDGGRLVVHDVHRDR
jgi:NTE family protein